MAVQAPAATGFSKLDEIIARVADASRAFVKLSIRDRIRLVDQMREGYRSIAEESVAAACHAKGLHPSSATAGEEWLAGPVIVLRNLRLTEEALKDIGRHGAPRIDPSWIRALPGERLGVQVYPANALDGTLLAKHTAEIYLQPGTSEKNVRSRQASFYAKPHGGAVCVVLGAGNVNSIPPTDVTYKLFVEGKACILKMNPVNAYLGPFIERAFRAAIEKGFLAVTYGAADEGAYLAQHPSVDEIHVTGSDSTYDSLVWGAPGPDREARKRRNEPLLKKKITAELGNISPVIVVPGPYESDELAFQAANIAGMVANNASFNCTAAKLLVTSRGWKKRQAFLQAVEDALHKATPRKAYYPGAEERWRRFTTGRSGIRIIGQAKSGELPYAFIRDVASDAPDEIVFREEPWCAVLSETALAPEDPSGFVEQAVRFVNDSVWGTLCATVIVHPKTMKDAAAQRAVENAIDDLRYGCVALNTWTSAGFALGSTPWGAYPGSPAQDIQSGCGWVHNSFMFEGIEKCVLRAPLKQFPVPPWIPGHRTLLQVARRLVDFEMDPSWLKVPAIATAALRS